MKILHTSDWHLGRSLYGRKRYREFSQFLDWLSRTIENENVDALLIAGDVFDTSTPSNRAQELYYRFLCRVAGSRCRHVVIIAGNHDSPSFLSAPKELLHAINVHVIGAITEDPKDEVIVIGDVEGKNPNLDAMAVICAVPYLRDKNIRTAAPGESLDDKNRKLASGIAQHYSEVAAVAMDKRNALLEERDSKNPDSEIPIIAMGHLFTANARTVDGDGVRELYVGSLAHINKDVFPPAIDYLALGHLHVPQRVGKEAHMRFCGSPIPMGFGEAKQNKKVLAVRFDGNRPAIREIQVPCFQPLERIAGSLDHILERIDQLKREESRAWLEIVYTGNDLVGNLGEILEAALAGSTLEIRRVSNKRVMDGIIRRTREEETLDDLDVNQVFERCLDAFDVPENDRKPLTTAYREIIHILHDENGDDV